MSLMPTDQHSMPNPAPALVADQVAQRIEQLIADGVLKTGQLLPSERRLTEKLGVSRSALREGLKLLRAREIIQTTHGKGSYVKSMTRLDASPLMHMYGTQPRTLYDLFEVRALLEGESARLAATRGTAADFISIKRRYEEMTAAGPDTSVGTHARLDHSFHLAICEASHNPVLVHTLKSLTDMMLTSVYACVNNLYHRVPEKQDIDRQHARLYSAVVNRRAAQAQRAALEHVHSVRDSLRGIEQEEQRLVRATLRLEGWH